MHARFQASRRRPHLVRFVPVLFAALLLQAIPTRAAEDTLLIDPAKPLEGWRFDNGREFPGAKGGLEADAQVEAQHRPALRLDGDFTGGGNYVQLGRNLPVVDLEALSFWIKAPQGMEQLTLRLIDGTGQCHQFNLRVEAHGNWQRVVFPVARYFDKAGTSASVELVKRYEGWGGAKDGKWHNPARSLHILVGRHSFGEALKGSLWIANARLQVAQPRTTVTYRESFDAAETLPEGWRVAGPAGVAALVADTPFDGTRSLRVQRSETQLNDAVSVTGAAFSAGPGPWSLGGALRSDLHSPDNSFAVRLNVEALDGAGNPIERTTLVDQTGKANWRAFARQVDLPRGTLKARFTATVHKTHGWCDIDALSAVPLEAKREEKLVERVVIGSDAVGNLFFPEDDLVFTLDVQGSRPLPAGEGRAFVTVRDYWGAEQFPALEVKLERSGLVDQRFRYRGTATVPKDALDVGKYYELHVAVPLTDFEDGAEYSGFARLPVAESRQYRPDQIPFTIRNWDSRIPAYFKLASRIGHRTIGLWGANGIDAVLAQGDVWYSGSRASEVERNGFKNITEEQLARETADFVRQHGANGMACLILGNEPNERPEGIPEKVRAYKIVYEAAKSVMPDLPVVATSVPAVEHFWEAGYHNYCDIFDFHVYETYEGIRNQIRRYKALMEKYGVDKPIWTTEIGLNSQGQTRHAVAQDVVKKITAFFAEGGANVSWFTIMYPDPNGKARGTSGDAHNTFDCQYSQYNPRLDAIMYYAMINGITIKKFADEVQHADGVQSYLFRDGDGECLHVLWKEGTRVDRAIPLPGVSEARLIRIDGSSVALTPRKGAVTLGLSGEPVMLRYRQPAAAPLARELAEPALTLTEQPLSILKGNRRELRATGPGLTADELAAEVPPRWTAEFRQDGEDTVVCTLSAPAETDARAGRVMLQRRTAQGAPDSEIILTMAIMGSVSVDILAAPRNADGEPGLRVLLNNNGTESASLTWTVELTESFPIGGGTFKLNAPAPVEAFLKGETEGNAALAGGAVREARVSIADSQPQTIYRARVVVTDEVGRRVTSERLVAGFATVVRTQEPITVDGRLDEPVWATAPVERIDSAAQVFRFGKAAPWRGADDLSGTWRGAWDDQYLYLAVEVTDDVHHVQFADGAIWNQDGLQFLFDPTRTLAEKAGKYDYSVGVGTKGPQAWCHLTAHSSVNEGPAPEFKIAATDHPGSPGGKTYEVAIPWTRLAPFKPEPGANLGMNLILNEDDGAGRVGFMGWFSGAHSKELDQVGDVVLGE